MQPAARDAECSLQRGAHTQFKESLRSDLLKRVEVTVRKRAGPSWDERMEKAVRGFQAKARASEAEQKKTLTESIERGRSRPTSAPIRSLALSPNQQAMLKERQKHMQQSESEYRVHLERLKDKMDKREPLFRVSEVNAAFAEQRRRMEEKKQQMSQDEHERWEHLRSVEETAASRPLLIEENGRRAPKKVEKIADSSQVNESTTRPKSAPFGREPYEKDIRIYEAVSRRDFLESDWGVTVAQIKDKVNNRKKLHEIEYPQRENAFGLARSRLMHSSAGRYYY